MYRYKNRLQSILASELKKNRYKNEVAYDVGARAFSVLSSSYPQASYTTLSFGILICVKVLDLSCKLKTKYCVFFHLSDFFCKNKKHRKIVQLIYLRKYELN